MRHAWLIGSVGLLLLASSPAGAQTLTLAEALDRAEAQSPLVDEARARVEAARGRARQAGVSPNPELSLEIENIAGSGDFRGARGAEATLAIGQRIELGGKRGARRDVAAADLNAANLRLTLARAEVARSGELRPGAFVRARIRPRANVGGHADGCEQPNGLPRSHRSSCGGEAVAAAGRDAQCGLRPL